MGFNVALRDDHVRDKKTGHLDLRWLGRGCVLVCSVVANDEASHILIRRLHSYYVRALNLLTPSPWLPSNHLELYH